MTYTQKDFQRAQVEAAHAWWDRCVLDEQEGRRATRDLITQMFTRTGWGWYLQDRFGEVYYHEKTGAGEYSQWCGLFVGDCARSVGDYLEPDQCVPWQLKKAVAQQPLASTYKLQSKKYWDKAHVEPAEDISPEDLQPGDIATVGDGSYGSHIVMVVEAPSGGSYKTIEGNAVGLLPDGTTGEGVVKKTRTLEETKRGYRLRVSHYEKVAI